jgi:S-adenosylmethionine uptake transporter
VIALVDRLPPLLVACLAIAVLTGMDAFVKGLSERYPTLQVTFLRFLFAAGLSAVLFAAVRPGRPSRAAYRLNILRGVFVALTATSFFYAIAALPLADVFAITYVAPILVALFSIPFLGERPGARVAIALLLGFMGVLATIGTLDFGAGGGRRIAGALAALFSAVTYALVLVLLRKQAQRDPPVTIVLFHAAVPATLLLVPAILVWQPLAASDAALFLLVGGLGVAGHLLLTRAFARAEASRLAPTEYTGIVWAALIGLTIFGEVPTWTTALGAILIVGGCLMLRR